MKSRKKIALYVSVVSILFIFSLFITGVKSELPGLNKSGLFGLSGIRISPGWVTYGNSSPSEESRCFFLDAAPSSIESRGFPYAVNEAQLSACNGSYNAFNPLAVGLNIFLIVGMTYISIAVFRVVFRKK